MKKVLIKNFSNVTSEGITLHLTEKTSLKTGQLQGKTFWVSWDKIGQALFDNYSTEESVKDLRASRSEN